jgi:hypothetical protein
MPGLIDKAMLIATTVWHDESETPSRGSEPAKRFSSFEVFHQVRMSWSCYIESQSGVMLAEARRSIYGKNRVRVHALAELVLNDFALTIDTAKSRK